MTSIGEYEMPEKDIKSQTNNFELETQFEQPLIAQQNMLAQPNMDVQAISFEPTVAQRVGNFVSGLTESLQSFRSKAAVVGATAVAFFGATELSSAGGDGSMPYNSSAAKQRYINMFKNCDQDTLILNGDRGKSASNHNGKMKLSYIVKGGVKYQRFTLVKKTSEVCDSVAERQDSRVRFVKKLKKNKAGKLYYDDPYQADTIKSTQSYVIAFKK